MGEATVEDGSAGWEDRLVATMDLQEKVSLLTGGSAWATTALPGVGLRAMVLSDGPSGVRGALWDERDPSLCLPSGTALSSSWDVDLARRYGAVVAGEARRKGVDVVLGPMVNLHRSPLGGRHFEALSEDPLLTADLAAAYVGGLQERGVAACPKHYVANDSETDRFTADVRVGERALHELYLAPFERAVAAGAWLVMSAYNSVNGVTATENALLTDPLTTTWGFDGVVVGDWTAVRSLASARTPQVLAMPGPEGPWGARLVQAVRAGEVGQAVVDAKVARVLRLAARVGALDGHEGAAPAVRDLPGEDGRAFARTAAAEGTVLVANDGLLPLEAAVLARVAVVGENARDARVQGGGSATVVPERTVSALEGLRDALPGAEVAFEVGALVQDRFAPLDPARMTNPVTGGPGAHVRHLAADGGELLVEERFAAFLLDVGREEVGPERTAVTFETDYAPEATGTVHLGFAAPGLGRVLVDGQVVLEHRLAEPADQVQAFFDPPSASAPVRVQAGRPLRLRFEFAPDGIIDGVPGSLSVTFGLQPAVPTAAEEDAAIARAVAAARGADVAVVVVGTTESLECEGYDRSDLALPGRQDDLVAAVAAANPRTVVVIDAGAPVEMPWRDDVAAVLLVWFGGQEVGHALADVLLGVVEPGGRLPTTWPARLADAPVSDVTPVGGVLRYDEGLHVGYRAWLRSGVVPAHPFGHGLGYTTWRLGPAGVAGPDGAGTTRVALEVENTGARAGKQVVQVYARRRASAVERPELWLVGFAVVRAEPGQVAVAEVEVPLRCLAHWEGGWAVEPGSYELLVGTSVASLAEPVAVEVTGATARSVR